MQAGLMGLRSALDKFDGSRGAKVSTFAYQAIRNSLYRTFMDSSRLVRIPQSTLDRVKEVQKVVNAFLDKYGRCAISLALDIYPLHTSFIMIPFLPLGETPPPCIGCQPDVHCALNH